eukprot:CAMPEP_0172845336 /NCGR_PEP_ID=MMETSP1075-20121228/32826_1 /TAXON_ID=2916 /ORGANISM="Ceratium fusus, Strain PA161109" /LENGTH=605 /DNA_ID=CAMNT_0013689925 /DNA_START=1 /DNA_END=1818 /DNA_ORIENTATION=-
MGVLVTIASFAGPLNSFIVGQLQDREFLSLCFPVSRWGRHAPWLLTHCMLAAMAAALIYLPPGTSVDGDSVVLYVWFMVLTLSAFWGVSGCFIAFEAARRETYPFKEERIIVEGFCKYACLVGGGTGGIVVLALMIDSSVQKRILFSAFLVPVGIVSLVAVPRFRNTQAEAVQPKATVGVEEGPDIDELPVKETNSPKNCEVAATSLDSEANATIHSGVLPLLAEALPSWCPGRNRKVRCNTALLCLLGVRFWDSAYASSIGSMILYYVTYTLGLSSWERAQTIAGAGMVAGVTEVIMNFVFMKVYSNGDGRTDRTGAADKQMLRLSVSLKVVNAIGTFLIIGIAPPSVPLVFLWAFTSRLNLCSFSYWRISAQCWLVDEDCLQAKKGRREATIFGALSMTAHFAGAVFAAATFFGLGFAGLTTRNCGSFCEASDALDQHVCIDDCFNATIKDQPESLRLYIRIVLGFWAPFCELLTALNAYSFPIKGARLRRLYHLVSRSRGEDPSNTGATDDAPPAHQARSRIVLWLEESEWLDEAGWATRLSHTNAFVTGRPGKKSISVLFDASRPLACSQRSAASSARLPSAGNCAGVPGEVIGLSTLEKE